MFERAAALIREQGATFADVVRTWVYLSDILEWYGEFNAARNAKYADFGLMPGLAGKQFLGPVQLPASTGIGLGPADGSSCAMDLFAVLEPPNSVENLQVTGRQQSALEYGSAFSRASRAITPAGETVFVSGTASIDASGATINIDDASAQITATIDNVRAVLRDMHCHDKEAVQAIAYCKTPQIEKIFSEMKGALPWPWVTVICDICRPDLLFEIEATFTRAV